MRISDWSSDVCSSDLGSVSITMRSAVRRSASGMGPDRADGSGEFDAARDALAAAVVVHHLLLVLEQQPVELVGQQVYRRVPVDGAGVGVEDPAGEVDRAFGTGERTRGGEGKVESVRVKQGG